MHELRAWCIAGLNVKHRKSPNEHPELGHSGVPYARFVAMSAGELDTLLERGLAVDAWVEEPVEEERDDEDTSSNASASSSSSS